MMFRLVLPKIKLTKLVFDFSVILASHYKMYVVVDEFLREILAALVFANAFSDNLE